jgi:hypothetical protein
LIQTVRKTPNAISDPHFHRGPDPQASVGAIVPR